MVHSAEQACVQALALGRASPASLPAQSGSHWTRPQVPMSTTLQSNMASTMGRRSGGEKSSGKGRACVRAVASCQRCDSGAQRRMKNVSKAGIAPMSATMRQVSWVIAKDKPTSALSKNPALPATPIAPASQTRSASGQTYMTKATPSAHSPPIPSAAMKRSAPSCAGVCAQ